MFISTYENNQSFNIYSPTNVYSDFGQILGQSGSIVYEKDNLHNLIGPRDRTFYSNNNWAGNFEPTKIDYALYDSTPFSYSYGTLGTINDAIYPLNYNGSENRYVAKFDYDDIKNSQLTWLSGVTYDSSKFGYSIGFGNELGTILSRGKYTNSQFSSRVAIASSNQDVPEPLSVDSEVSGYFYGLNALSNLSSNYRYGARESFTSVPEPHYAATSFKNLITSGNQVNVGIIPTNNGNTSVELNGDGSPTVSLRVSNMFYTKYLGVSGSYIYPEYNVNTNSDVKTVSFKYDVEGNSLLDDGVMVLNISSDTPMYINPSFSINSTQSETFTDSYRYISGYNSFSIPIGVLNLDDKTKNSNVYANLHMSGDLSSWKIYETYIISSGNQNQNVPLFMRGGSENVLLTKSAKLSNNIYYDESNYEFNGEKWGSFVSNYTPSTEFPSGFYTKDSFQGNSIVSTYGNGSGYLQESYTKYPVYDEYVKIDSSSSGILFGQFTNISFGQTVFTRTSWDYLNNADDQLLMNWQRSFGNQYRLTNDDTEIPFSILSENQTRMTSRPVFYQFEQHTSNDLIVYMYSFDSAGLPVSGNFNTANAKGANNFFNMFGVDGVRESSNIHEFALTKNSLNLSEMSSFFENKYKGSNVFSQELSSSGNYMGMTISGYRGNHGSNYSYYDFPIANANSAYLQTSGLTRPFNRYIEIPNLGEVIIDAVNGNAGEESAPTFNIWVENNSDSNYSGALLRSKLYLPMSGGGRYEMIGEDKIVPNGLNLLSAKFFPSANSVSSGWVAPTEFYGSGNINFAFELEEPDDDDKPVNVDIKFYSAEVAFNGYSVATGINTPTGMPLYLENSVVSNNIALYTRGHDATNSAANLYTQSADFINNNETLFIRNIPTTPISGEYEFPLFLKNPTIPVSGESRNLYVQALESINNDTNLFTRSFYETNNNLNLFIQNEEDVEFNMPLYLYNSGVPNIKVSPLYVRALESSSGNPELFTRSFYEQDGDMSLYIKQTTQPTSIFSLHLFNSGVVNFLSGTKDLYLDGIGTKTLGGYTPPNPQVTMYLGQGYESGNLNLYINGSTVADGGIGTTSGDMPLHLRGTPLPVLADMSTDTTLFLHTSGLTDGAQGLFTHGKDFYSTSGISMYLHFKRQGYITPLFINNGLQMTDNIPIFINGGAETSPLNLFLESTGRPKSGDVPIYLWSTTNSGLQKGATLYTDAANFSSVNLHLKASETNADNSSDMPLYMHGYMTRGSVAMFLKNANVASSGDTTMWMKGQSPDFSGVMPLYMSRLLEGVTHRMPITLWANQSGIQSADMYMEGIPTDNELLNMFISGGGFNTDNNKLYTHGY